MPATEGQMTEILRLAARLNRSTEAIETEFGRTLDSITRFDAREWIKKLREEAAASTPPAKVHFGTWPGLKDDREAVYLAQLRESNAALRVVLFNGQVFEGRISDFTPYTLTVEDGKGAGAVIVRKLAIAYYQQTGANAAAQDGAEAKDLAPFAGSGAPAFAGPDTAAATAQAEVAPPAEAPAAKPRATRARKTAAAAPATDSGISGGEGAPSTADGATSADSGEASG
jgi:sRNA-binding regulator protein Hfq